MSIKTWVIKLAILFPEEKHLDDLGDWLHRSISIFGQYLSGIFNLRNSDSVETAKHIIHPSGTDHSIADYLLHNGIGILPSDL